jgi:2-oxoglutarate/2-oxoacid ferredoxin oxidoreductase subunit beta
MTDVIAPEALTRKDFMTDQEVRWCPGCGDYSILATVQRVMPELGIARENMVWVSGIGCSSRFPYYMKTYGMHTIHGRAPGFATGIKLANPELSVWMATGDGDGLSIGGNHMLHLLRRNLDIKVLLFNNRIYGLTKGQYSPTSEFGKITKSTPEGAPDHPVDPSAFALGCGGTFVARGIDIDAKHMTNVLRRAAAHKGTAFMEIYQNCNVFNDHAFADFTGKDTKAETQLHVEHGKPLLFGTGNAKGLRVDAKTLRLEIVTVGENGITEEDVLVHDETNSVLAGLLVRMPFPEFPVALGVLYAKQRECYDATVAHQRAAALDKSGPADLDKLLNSGATWEI